MTQKAYDIVTERILELLRKGVCPWRQPWSRRDTAPRNYGSGRTYHGINHLLLSCLGFDQPYFMTFKQVQDCGGRVIKGSRGFPVVYWSTFTRDEAAQKGSTVEAPSQSEAGDKRRIPFLKMFTVFNIAQVEGISFPPPIQEPYRPFEPIAKAEEIVAAWKGGPEIRHGNYNACYVPAKDVILMPHKHLFESPAHYYCTLFHEMGHATGAAQRLGRPPIRRLGSVEHAREELVAEMTAAFLCAKCGIDNHVIENQAAYLSGWMEKLQKDPKLVTIAAGAAQKAADLIQSIDIEQQLTATKNLQWGREFAI